MPGVSTFKLFLQSAESTFLFCACVVPHNFTCQCTFAQPEDKFTAAPHQTQTPHPISTFRDMRESFRKRQLDELNSAAAANKIEWEAFCDEIVDKLPQTAAADLRSIARIYKELHWLDTTVLGNGRIQKKLTDAENRYHEIVNDYCAFMEPSDPMRSFHEKDLAPYVSTLNDIRAALQEYAGIAAVNSDKWNALVAALVRSREKCFSANFVEANRRVAWFIKSGINETDLLELVTCWHGKVKTRLEFAIQSPENYAHALAVFESLRCAPLWCAETVCRCAFATKECQSVHLLFTKLLPDLQDLRFTFAEPHNFLNLLAIIHGWRQLPPEVTLSSRDALDHLKESFQEVTSKLKQTGSPFRDADEMRNTLSWARLLEQHFDELQSYEYFGEVASLKQHIDRHLTAADSMIAWASWRPKRVAAIVGTFIIHVIRRSGRALANAVRLPSPPWPQVPSVRRSEVDVDSGEPTVEGLLALPTL
jgi:hypothetical protein